MSIQTKGDSEWQAIKEIRTGQFVSGERGYHTATYEVDGIRRRDGFSVVWQRKLASHDKIDVFLCKTNSSEFEFSADRFDSNRKLTNKYIVYTDMMGTKDLCIAVSKDIEDALRHFPLKAEYTNMPIAEVLFKIFDSTRKNSKLLCADQLQSSENYRI